MRWVVPAVAVMVMITGWLGYVLTRPLTPVQITTHVHYVKPDYMAVLGDGALGVWWDEASDRARVALLVLDPIGHGRLVVVSRLGNRHMWYVNEFRIVDAAKCALDLTAAEGGSRVHCEGRMTGDKTAPVLAIERAWPALPWDLPLNLRLGPVPQDWSAVAASLRAEVPTR